jgi:hypothetical protein
MVMVQTEVSVLDSPHTIYKACRNEKQQVRSSDLPLCNHLPIGAITS